MKKKLRHAMKSHSFSNVISCNTVTSHFTFLCHIRYCVTSLTPLCSSHCCVRLSVTIAILGHPSHVSNSFSASRPSHYDTRHMSTTASQRHIHHTRHTSTITTLNIHHARHTIDSITTFTSTTPVTPAPSQRHIRHLASLHVVLGARHVVPAGDPAEGAPLHHAVAAEVVGVEQDHHDHHEHSEGGAYLAEG